MTLNHVPLSRTRLLKKSVSRLRRPSDVPSHWLQSVRISGRRSIAELPRLLTAMAFPKACLSLDLLFG